MATGEASANGSVAGFIRSEQITLSTTPTGTNYAWGQAIPVGSTTARSSLSATTGASITFTPDVAGYYVISCTVDSTTTYTLVISVTDTVTSTTTEALRVQAKADAGVPSPNALALAVYVSLATQGLVEKGPSAQIIPLRPGIIGANLTDADETLTVGQGVHRCIPALPLTSNRTKTLSTSGASVGHVIEIARIDSAAFTVAVVNGGPGAGTIFTFPASQLHSAEFRFDGTNWSLQERRQLV